MTSTLRGGFPNPLRRFPEKRSFESWGQIRAVARRLGPVSGPMVVFGAATGLRPAELAALSSETSTALSGSSMSADSSCVVGKQTKTRRSVRAVPLQSIALEALDQLPKLESPLLFRHRAAVTST